MSFGYIGDISTKIKQQVKNEGILSVTELLELEKDGFLGGSLELIEEKSISGVSSAIFTDIKENVYDVHFLQINDYQPISDNTDIRVRFFESGVEQSGSVRQYAFEFMTANGSRGEVQDTSSTYIRATFNTGNSTNEKQVSYNYFYNLGNSAKNSFQTMQTCGMNNLTEFITAFGGGVLGQASTVNQIKLFNGSGNFSCTASLYGVKQ
jgi:hypothetical protein